MTKKENLIIFFTILMTLVGFYNASLEDKSTKAAFSHTSKLISLYYQINLLQNTLSSQNLQLATWTNCLDKANEAQDCEQIKKLADIETGNYQRAFEQMSQKVDDFNALEKWYFDIEKIKNERQRWLNYIFYFSSFLIILVLILPPEKIYNFLKRKLRELIKSKKYWHKK